MVAELAAEINFYVSIAYK